jgi:hypothetical protein
VLAFGGLGLSHTITDADKLSIDVLETSPQRVLDGLLDLPLNETSGERFEGLVEEIMLRVADGELERVNLDVNVVNSEDGRAILLRRHQMDCSTQTLSTEDDVSETRVLHLRQAGFLVVVEGDVTHIGLNLLQCDGDAVTMIVLDGVIGRKFHEILSLELDDVGEDVATLESKVLDDEIEGVVTVLDTRDGNVADFLNESGHNDLANVIPEFALELEGSLAIEEKVLGEASPVFTELLIDWIITHSLEPVADAVEEVVEVGAVLLVIELATGLADTLSMTIAVRLKDVTGLEEDLADVEIDGGEPLAERLVVASIVDEIVDGVNDDLQGHAISEAFKESAKLASRAFDVLVLHNTSSVVLAGASESAAVLNVLFNKAKKPANGFLVVVVLLALHDYLLATEDELVTTFFWEVLLREKVFGAIELFSHGILMFLRNALVDAALNIIAEAPHLLHHTALLFVSDGVRLIGICNILRMSLAFLAGDLLVSHGLCLELIGFDLSLIAHFAERLSRTISVLEMGLIVLGVSLHALIDSRNLGLEDGRLAWSSDAAAFCDELVVGRGLIDLLKLLLGRCDHLARLHGTLGEEVATDDGEVGKEFANFGICEDKSHQGTEMFNGFVAVSLGLVAVHRNLVCQIAWLEVLSVDIAGMPNEVLEQFIGVLLLDHHASCADDLAGILDELLSLRRELVDVDGGVVKDMLKSLVDLSIGGKSPLAEGVDNTVETNLSIDVGILVGLVDWVNDGAFRWVGADIFGSG